MQTLSDFIDNFEWEADGPIDSYHILKTGEKGDCDDFAATVSYIQSGGVLKMLFNIFVGNHKFYWCKSPTNEAHIILYIKGYGFIDNIYPMWRQTPDGHTQLKYLWIKPYLKLLIGKIVKT